MSIIVVEDLIRRFNNYLAMLFTNEWKFKYLVERFNPLMGWREKIRKKNGKKENKEKSVFFSFCLVEKKSEKKKEKMII